MMIGLKQITALNIHELSHFTLSKTYFEDAGDSDDERWTPENQYRTIRKRLSKLKPPASNLANLLSIVGKYYYDMRQILF